MLTFEKVLAAFKDYLEEDDCCTRYRAIFDAQVNMIDDTMERQRNPPNTAKL